MKKFSKHAAGGLHSTFVGANYVVDARIQGGGGGTSGDWARNITDDSHADLFNKIPAGTSSRVQFSNDWNTPVDVQVEGTWRAR